MPQGSKNLSYCQFKHVIAVFTQFALACCNPFDSAKSYALIHCLCYAAVFEDVNEPLWARQNH